MPKVKRKKLFKPDVKTAVEMLEIAHLNLGKSWPTVNLSVAGALHALTGKKPKVAVDTETQEPPFEPAHVAALAAEARKWDSGELTPKGWQNAPEALPSAKGPTTRLLWVQEWEESEAGWGTRPDGFTMHEKREDIDAYLKEMRAREQEGKPEDYVPSEYSRPCGEPFQCEVDVKCIGNAPLGNGRWLPADWKRPK